MHCNMRESRNDEFDRRLALITLHETPHLPVIGRACREAKNGFCHDQMSGDGASYCDRHSSRLGNLPIYAGFLREGSLSDLSKAARVVRAARVGIGIGCLTARQPRSCINQPQKLASTTANYSVTLVTGTHRLGQGSRNARPEPPGRLNTQASDINFATRAMLRPRPPASADRPLAGRPAITSSVRAGELVVRRCGSGRSGT